MSATAMTDTAVSTYITETFADVFPVGAWGDTFFYYHPDRAYEPSVYFATLKTNDDEYDRVSKLGRAGVFRLNLGLAKASYRRLFGLDPSQKEADLAAYDLAALDTLLPHPVYGRAGWVCILNPAPATFEKVVTPLLAEAFELAVKRYSKQVRTALG